LDLGIELKTNFRDFDADETGELLSPIICSDEQRFKQVLLNLLSNALKFTKEGSVTIDVQLLEATNFYSLRVSVRDTGIGIPYED